MNITTPPAPPSRIQRFQLRYPVLFAGLAALLVLVGLALAITGWANLAFPDQCSEVHAFTATGEETPILSHQC